MRAIMGESPLQPDWLHEDESGSPGQGADLNGVRPKKQRKAAESGVSAARWRFCGAPDPQAFAREPSHRSRDASYLISGMFAAMS